jgi:hypothetical protein
MSLVRLADVANMQSLCATSRAWRQRRKGLDKRVAIDLHGGADGNYVCLRLEIVCLRREIVDLYILKGVPREPKSSEDQTTRNSDFSIKSSSLGGFYNIPTRLSHLSLPPWYLLDRLWFYHMLSSFALNSGFRFTVLMIYRLPTPDEFPGTQTATWAERQ